MHEAMHDSISPPHVLGIIQKEKIKKRKPGISEVKREEEAPSYEVKKFWGWDDYSS